MSYQQAKEMEISMFQNYVFSFYGTLAEVKMNLQEQGLWEKLSVYYGIYDYPVDADTLRRSFFTALAQEEEKKADKIYYEPNYEDILLRLFNIKKLKGKNRSPKDIGRFFHLLAAEELTLFPQVKKTLELLKKEDRNVYLLANAQKSFIKDQLRYFGIKEYFDGLYISSDYSLKKPSPVFFNQVINENKLEKKKTLFVGSDFETDLLPAKKLGYLTCLVLRSGRVLSSAERADFVVDNGELKKVLEF